VTAIDTAKAVLAKASLSDQTFAHPDLGIAVAWAEILGDIDRDAALRAVTAHYANETRRLMPADVLRRVKVEQTDAARRHHDAQVFAEIERAKAQAVPPPTLEGSSS
jgi:hypothetical protein